MINLVAEVEELKAETGKPSSGVVIEAELNHQRGPTAMLLVKEGTLRKNDIVSLSSTFGRARELENFLGKGIDSSGPGSPAFVVGLSEVPQVGEKFKVVQSIKEAESIMGEKQKKYGLEREIIEQKEGAKILNVVLKADAGGTLEAVHDILRSIKSDNFYIRVLSENTGDIVESDVKLASAAGAIIIGFRTKLNQSAELFARQMKVEIILGNVIYDLVENVRAKINELLSKGSEEVEIGEFKVLAIFRTEKSRMIVGGKVIEGEIKRGAKIHVARDNNIIGEGRVAQLKIGEKAVDKAEKGKECGVLFEGPVRILLGDIFKIYEVRKMNVKI
jgi:translation initiation factor IF-2